MTKFSHLHVHTQYSLLDGAASIKGLFKKANDFEMPALAITDHGNMFGAFDFVAEAWKNLDEFGKPKVKPIVGCEFYVVADRHKKSFTREQKDERFHQVLLAKNAEGYQNLVKLTSLGFIEGLYGKYPRIDKELILKYHKGLIATTCCLGAHVPQLIMNKSEEEAEMEFKWWLEVFGDDYYVELQRHQLIEQNKVNEVLVKFAHKHGVKMIATNDSHYTNKEDANAHDILLCINTGEAQSVPGYDDFVNDDISGKNRRFKFPNNEFYFKSPDEMQLLFQDIPEAIDNTNAIIDKVETLNLKKDILLPAFPIPQEFKIHDDNNMNQWEYLRHLTMEGAKERYVVLTAEIQERIDFELFTIKTMGFAGYFLIVSDFIKAGRELGVLVGPGRGSAAGSVVAYCIGITNIDPIKYSLLFERFLNPDRKSMPDIDTDFDDEGREKVISYVVNKYGKNQVAQIITYGTMAAKMSIKDVARAMELPLVEANILAKLVPEKPGIELGRLLNAPIFAKEGEKSLEEKENLGAEEIESVKQLRKIYQTDGLKGQVLREAEKLEGSVRNTGIHAAGIIIAPDDLMNIIPVCTAKDSELWVTQIEGKSIEEAGVIKMDFLGLKTLTILRDAIQLIKQNHGVEIDLDLIPLDDNKTFELYQKGETNGTFQFESLGMQKYLKELKPDKLDDLIAMNALFRPGPLAYIPNFINRKLGKEKISYDLPEMEEFLKETYGITVYQEQVMLLSQKLAGFSKGDADVLRKAMGKKDRKTLDKMKSKFIEGAEEKGHDKKVLEKVWTDWEAFAQYAFNKSHSTCYSIVAYQTAYLKANYPSEYMAAVLANNMSDIKKLSFLMEECKRMGINVLGPDINESQSAFAVNKNGEIRFGLSAVKGVGQGAVEELIKDRDTNGPFKSIFDVTTRINPRSISKKTLENLCKAGAFDFDSRYHRAQYFISGEGKENGIELAIKYGQKVQINKLSGQGSLFGGSSGMEEAEPKLPAIAEMELMEKLKYEYELVGVYLSNHPLDAHRFSYKILATHTISEIIENSKETLLKPYPFQVMGIISAVRPGMNQKNEPYTRFTLEDYQASYEFGLFGKDFLKWKNLIEKDYVIMVKGTFQWDEYASRNKVKYSDIVMPGEASKDVVTGMTVILNAVEFESGKNQILEEAVEMFPGKIPLYIHFSDHDENMRLELMSAKGLNPCVELMDMLDDLEITYKFHSSVK